MSTWVRLTTILATVGAGCIGGVFFAFSGFVMPALGRLSPRDAVTTMQSINISAVRPPLMIALFGTAACCVALAIAAFGEDLSDTRRLLMLAGVLLYLVGAVGLTIGYHVPLNDRLVGADPSAAGTVAQWNDYLSGWTRWNSVRAGASLAAAASFVLALFQP